MKVLIVGATGMLGYSLFCNLSDVEYLDVYGTVRSIYNKKIFFENYDEHIFEGVDAYDLETLGIIIKKIAPAVVINCIGLIKQHDISKNHVDSVTINSLLPHKLASLCDANSCKLIHFSTDCVFDGSKGLYTEDEYPDAQDLYGLSKRLGEIDYFPHLTLRTSIIGLELNSSVSLVDWFLSQEEEVKGFSNAIFSGLPTCLIAQLLIDNILPKQDLSGLYHLSTDPIDKFTLLNFIAEVYKKNIIITESKDVIVDRSLNSERLHDILYWDHESWKVMISKMHADFIKRYKGYR